MILNDEQFAELSRSSYWRTQDCQDVIETITDLKGQIAALNEPMPCGHPKACRMEAQPAPSIYMEAHCTACDHERLAVAAALREAAARTVLALEEEYARQEEAIGSQPSFNVVVKLAHDSIIAADAKALEAHVADLKRQLQQALAQVEIVDRALGDPGNTSSKVALHAYVQETVDPLLHALDAVYQDLGAWQSDRTRAPVGPYAYRLMEKALNRNKVTAADPPKEK